MIRSSWRVSLRLRCCSSPAVMDTATVLTNLLLQRTLHGEPLCSPKPWQRYRHEAVSVRHYFSEPKGGRIWDYLGLITKKRNPQPWWKGKNAFFMLLIEI